MSKLECVYYRLDAMDDLVLFSDEDVRTLDWRVDLAMIRRFYRHWTEDEIQPPESEPEIGDPVALVQDGEILSFAIPFAFKPGEIEIGAVATIPAHQNKGYCRRVIAAAARQILSGHLSATLTTYKDNWAMQAAAEAIGMRRVEASSVE